MTTDFCEHCDLPLAWCQHGQAQQSRQAVPTAWPNWLAEVYEAAAEGLGSRIGPLIEAQYHGRCPGCTGRWEPGELICFDEEQDSWICADCAG